MDDSGSGPARPVVPLHVGANGLDFFIDDQNPLMAYASEKNGEPLKVTALTQKETGFVIDFTGKVSVSFASERRGEADVVTITASMPAKYQKIAFPYRVTRSARLEKKDSLVLVNVGNAQYAFTGAAIDPAAVSAARPLAISRSAPVVHYQTWIPAKGLAIEDLASYPGSSKADYERVVAGYAASALLSFKEAVSAGKLSEPLVAAYIAEMGRIGMYQAAIESIPDSWRNGSARTWQTNTFLNHLEKTYAGYMAKERENRSMISRKLTEGSPSVFEFPSLVPYLIDRGSSVLLKDVSRLASSLDMTAVTSREAAGILEAMMDSVARVSPGDDSLIALSDSCERKLKASLVIVGDKLYLSDDGSTVNSVASLEIAGILMRYADSSAAKSPWGAAGRLLVSSLAAVADEKGNVSARYSLVGGADSGGRTGLEAQGEAILGPETVYPALVLGNTWYPHALSLADQAGPGVWAWTSAQSIKATKSADGVLRVTTRFPLGETHYMILNGIKPFYRIQIYGVDFHTDARYESYNSSGYRYNEATQTLYLKMRHKSEYEEVVIYLGADPAAPAPAASQAEGSASPVPESAAGTTGTGTASPAGQ